MEIFKSFFILLIIIMSLMTTSTPCPAIVISVLVKNLTSSVKCWGSYLRNNIIYILKVLRQHESFNNVLHHLKVIYFVVHIIVFIYFDFDFSMRRN